MRRLLPLLAGALPILIAAGFILNRQNRALQAAETRREAATAAATQASVPLPAGSQPATETESAALPADDPRLKQDSVLDRVTAMVQESYSTEQLAGFADSGRRYLAAEVKLIAGLTAGEEEEFLTFLRSQGNERASLIYDRKLSAAVRSAGIGALDRVRDEWLQQKLGTERWKKWTASRESSQQAEAEYQASKAAAEVDRAVRLTPEQKDALYSRFVEKAKVQQEAAPAQPLAVLSNFSIEEAPPPPDVSAAVKAILTPEQLEMLSARSSKLASREALGMMEMMPSLLPVLQKVLKEENPAD